jgi:hypothetical protein
VLVQIADQIDQLLDRPAQPVELPDDQSDACDKADREQTQ